MSEEKKTEPSKSNQLFGRQSNWLLRTFFFGLPAFLLIVISVAVAFDRSDSITSVGESLQQPVPFSHKHHAGQMSISCMYCHNQAQESRIAQIPSTQVCAGCHQKIWTDAPMLQPVLKSAESGSPLIWNKVTRIPDYVFFDHQVHIASLTQAQIGNSKPQPHDNHPHDLQAQVASEENVQIQHFSPPTEKQTRNACTLCHGKVEEMPLTSLAHPMTMAFCLNCHRDPSAYLKAHSVEVFDSKNLQSKMDCVTCHR